MEVIFNEIDFFSSIKKKWQLTQARNMCIIFSLVPSKKLRKTKCLLFNFWMIEFTVILKKAIGHLTIWQNWCLGQFYHSKTWKVNNYVACFSFLWWKGFFERTIENILHIFQSSGSTALCITNWRISKGLFDFTKKSTKFF